MKRLSRAGSKSTRRTRASAASSARSPRGSERTLESIVGPETYGVWVAMLAALVPGGRSHRLVPLIGGMLQYASGLAYRKFKRKPPKNSAAVSLLDALEDPDPESALGEISDIVERLFRDANVPHGRTNHRGDAYSIVDAAVAEFVQWDLMPWE